MKNAFTPPQNNQDDHREETIINWFGISYQIAYHHRYLFLCGSLFREDAESLRLFRSSDLLPTPPLRLKSRRSRPPSLEEAVIKFRE